MQRGESKGGAPRTCDARMIYKSWFRASREDRTATAPIVLITSDSVSNTGRPIEPRAIGLRESALTSTMPSRMIITGSENGNNAW